MTTSVVPITPNRVPRGCNHCAGITEILEQSAATVGPITGCGAGGRCWFPWGVGPWLRLDNADQEVRDLFDADNCGCQCHEPYRILSGNKL